MHNVDRVERIKLCPMQLIKNLWGTHSEEGQSNDAGFTLKSLFEEHYDRLVYFSYQFVKNKHQAEDLVQDAFIKYWSCRENIAPNNCAVKNYLYTTVKNQSLNVIRHNKIVDTYVSKQQEEPLDQPIIDALITAEVVAEIHQAIYSLPEEYRVISLKGFIERKKNQEIATELNMSVNTVKKRKQKALQLLRLKLSPDLLAILLYLYQ